MGESIGLFNTNIATSMTRVEAPYPEGAMRACLCYLNENADYLGRNLPFSVK